MFLSDRTMQLLMELDAPADKKTALLQSLLADEAAARPVRSSNAERQARHRAKVAAAKAEDITSVTEITPVTPCVTEHNANETENNGSVASNAPLTCERAQVVTLTSSLRSEGNPPVKPIGLTAPKGAETARGSRLPESWTPDEAGWGYAAEILGPDIDPRREFDRFRDYWRSVPGAKGRKSDWPATWRNWCRNAAERLPARKAHVRPHDDKLTRKQANLARAFAGSERAAGLRGEP